MIARSPEHIVLSLYPQHYEASWILKDGTSVLLRPIKPGDEAMMTEFFNTLYYHKFLTTTRDTEPG